MQYVDIPFPRRIAMGAQRRPGWRTDVTQTISGHERANQRWSMARYQYELSMAVRTATDYQDVEAHFHAVRGRARAFPFRDALDHRVDAIRSAIVDNGDSPGGWQLAKTYGSGAEAWMRFITRPLAGAAVYRLRSGSTTDISANSTIDLTTGAVVFDGGAVQPGDVLRWSGEFVVPCRYDTDELPGVVVDRHPGANGDLLVQCNNIPLVEVRE